AGGPDPPPRRRRRRKRSRPRGAGPGRRGGRCRRPRATSRSWMEKRRCRRAGRVGGAPLDFET
ncbi:MAG: hypothetical protein E6J60_12005, partial [Deltaproteobacteria bacterium]